MSVKPDSLERFFSGLQDPEWRAALESRVDQAHLSDLTEFLDAEAKGGVDIFPARERWFAALDATPLDRVRVVIIGQDPYPTPGHAHGLSFSVLPDVAPLPRSLANIYKELETDLGIKNTNGYLQPWAEQGVLMLNAVLTVRSGAPGSHQNRGWEEITDAMIDCLANRDEPVVFVLWGGYAQKKGKRLAGTHHDIHRSAHPSPLSAYRGFFGSQPFSSINRFLVSRGQKAIDWAI